MPNLKYPWQNPAFAPQEKQLFGRSQVCCAMETLQLSGERDSSARFGVHQHSCINAAEVLLYFLVLRGGGQYGIVCCRLLTRRKILGEEHRAACNRAEGRCAAVVPTSFGPTITGPAALNQHGPGHSSATALPHWQKGRK